MIDVTKPPYNCNPGNPTFDNAPGLQQAFQDGSAAFPGGPVQRVYIPGGHYNCYGPPVQITSGTSIVGDGPYATILEHRTGSGPGFLIAPAASQLGSPPLVTDSNGTAFLFDGTNSYAYDLRNDTAALDVNGLGQFCVEAVVSASSLSGGPNCIVSSSGRKGDEPVSQAFSLGTSGNQAFATLTLGGQSHTLYGPATLAVGQPIHLALSYDGAVIRFWGCLPGGSAVILSSVTASGSITQAVTEDVMFGPSCQDWPACTTVLSNSFKGSVYALRFSSTARYVATYSFPGFTLPTDASTLLCLFGSFDTVHGLCITSTAHDYLPIRWFNKVFVAGTQSVEIQDLSITGTGGLLMMYSQNGYLRNVIFNCFGRYGLMMWCNCFHHDWQRVQSVGGSRFGIVGAIAAGLIRVAGGLVVQGGLFPLAISNGSLSASQIHIVPSSTTDTALFCKNAGGQSALHCLDMELDAESGTGPVFLCDMDNVSILGGNVDVLGSGPAVIVSGGKAHVFAGTSFQTTGAYVIHEITSPSQPIRVLGCNRPSQAAWSDVIGGVTEL